MQGDIITDPMLCWLPEDLNCIKCQQGPNIRLSVYSFVRKKKNPFCFASKEVILVLVCGKA